MLFYLANRIFVFSVNRGSTEFDCTGSLSIRTSSHPFVAKGWRRIFVSQPRRLLSWSSTYSDVFHVAHPGSSNLRRSKPKPSETQVNMVSKLVRCMYNVKKLVRCTFQTLLVVNALQFASDVIHPLPIRSAKVCGACIARLRRAQTSMPPKT